LEIGGGKSKKSGTSNSEPFQQAGQQAPTVTVSINSNEKKKSKSDIALSPKVKRKIDPVVLKGLVFI